MLELGDLLVNIHRRDIFNDKKLGKNPKCPSIQECINKLLFMHKYSENEQTTAS